MLWRLGGGRFWLYRGGFWLWGGSGGGGPPGRALGGGRFLRNGRFQAGRRRGLAGSPYYPRGNGRNLGFFDFFQVFGTFSSSHWRLLPDSGVVIRQNAIKKSRKHGFPMKFLF
jgi:hypothetical protein